MNDIDSLERKLDQVLNAIDKTNSLLEIHLENNFSLLEKQFDETNKKLFEISSDTNSWLGSIDENLDSIRRDANQININTDKRTHLIR